MLSHVIVLDWCSQVLMVLVTSGFILHFHQAPSALIFHDLKMVKNITRFFRNGWRSPILSSFSLRFRDDKAPAVTVPPIKPL
jgi:hypothetical protein